jgi:DNA-binding MarR family transcriptional regulator
MLRDLNMPKQRKRSAKSRAEPKPAGSGLPARTEQFIIYKVGLLSKLLDRQSMPWFADQFGLALAEWRTLTHLYVCSPTTARALAARMHVDKGEVSRALAALVARGAVVRKPDPDDKRSALFEITRAGCRLHDAIFPLRQATQDRLAACLTKRELATLRRALDKLIARAMGRPETKPTKNVDQQRTRKRAVTVQPRA